MSAEEEMELSSDSAIRKEKEKLPPLKEMKRETLGQTYQYVNRLVKERQSDDFENVGRLVASDEPLPSFEESLRLIIIDSLKMEDEVLKVLLSQDNYAIKRILRCDWFFQSSLSPDDYCMKIFPQVSVSLRHKLTNRLSKNVKREQDAEKLFISICSDYSYRNAEVLLPRCSPQFILDFFNKKKPMFESERSATVLLKITQRYPSVSLHILDAIFGVNVYDYTLHPLKRACLYLAQKHPESFVPFFKKHHSKMNFLKFGRKLSQKLGSLLKDFVIETPNLRMFKEEVLFRVLSLEHQAKYLASRVKFVSPTLSLDNWAKATNSLTALLKLLPPADVLPVIESAFKQVYHSNFSDCPKAWELQLLEVIPLAERLPFVKSLEKYVAIDIANQDGDGLNLYQFLVFEISQEPQKVICLKECSVALDEFKRILRKAPSLNEREKILRYAVRNCVINKDAKGLEELLEHVRTRLRNENHKLIFKILDEVIESFPKSALTLTSIQKLEEISYMGAIRGDTYHYHLIMEKCILRRMDEGMEVKAQVRSVVDLALAREVSGRGVVRDVRSRHSINLFWEYYREIFRWIRENPSNESMKRYLTNLLLETVSIFNYIHRRNHPILLRDLPELSAELEEVVRERHGSVSFDFDWIDLWERFSESVKLVSYRARFFRHCLKRNPMAVIRTNVEPVWKHLCENYSPRGEELNLFLDLRKIYSFLGETGDVKTRLLDELRTGTSITVKKAALKMYARVCSAEEFGRAIEVYTPRRGMLDVQEEASLLELQLVIPVAIKDVKPDWRNLPLISKFLKRDFLKYVSPALMSYCYHTRVDVLVANLLELLTAIPEYGRIAYEKTIVRLVAEVLNRKDKLEFCSRRWKESQHYSVRTVLLRFISESFLDHPNRDSFRVLSECVLESDTVIIDARPELSRVPKEFVSDYVGLLWRFSESQTRMFRKSFRNSILWFFNTRNVGWLSEELTREIIKDNLFRRSGVDVDNFAACYLLSDSEKVERRVREVLDLLRDPETDETTVSPFLKTLKVIWLDGSYPPIFDVVLRNWPDSFALPLDERLSLNYFSRYEKTLGTVPEGDTVSRQFAKRLKGFLNTFDDSNDLILIFVESLGNFFHLFGESKKLNIVVVAGELLAHPSSRSLAVVAVLILPNAVVDFYKMKRSDLVKDSSDVDFVNVIRLLEDNQDEVVQIYFRRRFGFKKFKSNADSS